MRRMTQELLTEGCTRAVTYRWADGYRQTAFFQPHQMHEHLAWLLDHPIVARRCWVRDVASGRFCRALPFA